MNNNSELVTPESYASLFELKRDYNSSHKIKKYIHGCAELFSKIICSKINSEDILYFNFFGYDFKTKRLITVNDFDKDFYKNNQLFDPVIVHRFHIGFSRITRGKMIGITQRLVKQKINFLLMASDKRELKDFKAYFKDSVTFDFDALSNDEICDSSFVNFANSLGINPSEYKKLIETIKYHKYIYENYKNYYIYFIRPRVFHEEYIGCLFIAVQKPLAHQYVHQLSPFINEVISETAISRIRQLEKRNTINQINHELYHTWNSYFTTLWLVVENDIMHLAINGKIDELLEKRNYLKENINSILKINKFFVGLMKINDDFKNIDSLLKKVYGQDFLFLKEKIFNIKLLISNILKVLKYNLGLNHSDKDNLLSSIEKLEQENSKRINWIISSNETALEIILINMIKNAVLHSEIGNRKIEILIYQTKLFLIIEVINSGHIPLDWVDFYNKKIIKVENIEYTAGVRTIMRISHFFKWKNSAKRISKPSKKTKIKLKIPLSKCKLSVK